MMISMSVAHSLSISCLRRIMHSVHYGSFEDWIYSIVDGNSSNDFYHDDFNVCGIFSKLWCFIRRTQFSPQRVTVNLLLSEYARN